MGFRDLVFLAADADGKAASLQMSRIVGNAALQMRHAKGKRQARQRS
jgi:hypothetical protein